MVINKRKASCKNVTAEVTMLKPMHVYLLMIFRVSKAGKLIYWKLDLTGT